MENVTRTFSIPPSAEQLLNEHANNRPGHNFADAVCHALLTLGLVDAELTTAEDTSYTLWYVPGAKTQERLLKLWGRRGLLSMELQLPELCALNENDITVTFDAHIITKADDTLTAFTAAHKVTRHQALYCGIQLMVMAQQGDLSLLAKSGNRRFIQIG